MQCFTIFNGTKNQPDITEHISVKYIELGVRNKKQIILYLLIYLKTSIMSLKSKSSSKNKATLKTYKKKPLFQGI